MIRVRNARRGAALLEAVAALVILSVAGTAALQLARASGAAVVAVQARDADVARGSALLDMMALWSVEDLDRNLGVRINEGWQVQVEKAGSIYRVTLADTQSQQVLLETALFRRDASASAAP